MGLLPTFDFSFLIVKLGRMPIYNLIVVAFMLHAMRSRGRAGLARSLAGLLGYWVGDSALESGGIMSFVARVGGN